ncbi:MAG TPA: GNAT family N-acetyltransferase [Aestuariivirga sp.]|nr:GNAT family N-acetyltransferase [Aestuariivirga sp.]
MTTLTVISPVETPHLLLREIAPGDNDQFAAYMLQPRYQRYVNMRLKDMVEVDDFVARSLARQGDDRRRIFHLAAEERLSGDVVGDGFLLLQPDGAVEMGWGIHPAMWSMGLGTEIGRALLGLGFERLGARTMWCKVMVDNIASLKLARRIGLRFERAHNHYPLTGGGFGTVEIFRLNAADYFELPY